VIALIFLPVVVLGGMPGLEIVRPMAVVILGGIVTSTFLSLFVAPALYLRIGLSRADPTRVEAVAGTDDLHRVILTAEAAERLDVQTVPVGEGEGEGMKQRTVVPYAAVLYETNGETWAYTSPEPLTFVRHRIVVESIDGDRAVLSEGPPAGTEVVTVGVAELFGAEYGVGGDEGH
jgi:hypothetical protein